MPIGLILVVLLSIDLSGFCLTLASLSLYSWLTTGQYHDIALTTGKYHDIALTTIQYYIYALWRYFDLCHKWTTNRVDKCGHHNKYMCKVWTPIVVINAHKVKKIKWSCITLDSNGISCIGNVKFNFKFNSKKNRCKASTCSWSSVFSFRLSYNQELRLLIHSSSYSNKTSL